MTTLAIFEQTLKNLDWLNIAQNISNFAFFNITKDKIVLGPKLFSNLEIDNHLFKLKSLVQLISSGSLIEDFVFTNFKDSQTNHQFIKGLEKGKIGDFDELNFICVLVENFASLRAYFKDNTLFEFPHNQSDFDLIKNKFIRTFRSFVDKDGSVHLEKHPLLAPKILLRNQLESKIRETIQYTLKSEEFEKRLQFNTFDIMNDRYVVPVRSDSYNANLGLIVSRSSTGSTLFVEPFSVRELCNKRILILNEIDEIINRICMDFCSFLNTKINYIKIAYEEIIDFDYLLMSAKYCEFKDFIMPEVVYDGHYILQNFYHPLISKCVENTIEFQPEHDGLVISGPNTGGKTVTIKSIVLAHVFLKLGFFIPATRARIKLMNDIFYFDSDYQNLSNGLSSFAGEASAILEMMHNLSNDSLVATDEIFNSTGSDEASALALSIIDHLTKQKNALILVSTHHQLLKTSIQERPNFISSHVGYDFDNNIPTFKLQLGSPGSSMALTIFEKISASYHIDPLILENAKSILDSKYITYESLLQDLTSKKTQLEKIVLENKELNNHLKNQKKSMEGILFLEKNKLFEEYKLKLEKSIKQIHDIKNDERLEYKQKLKMAHSQNAAFDNLSPKQTLNPAGESLKNATTFIVNENYYCDIFKAEAKLVETKSNKAVMFFKGKNIQVPLESLYIPKRLENRSPEKKTPRVTVNVFRDTNSNISLDCRGMRLENFQSILDSSLHSLILGEIPYLNVVHGHGSGVLKNYLRDLLRKNSDFSWAPEDGNDGCTRIELSNNQNTSKKI